VLLYEMLTGAKPHGGGTPAQILYQHLHDEVAPPSAAVPGLAPQLDSLVATAVARDPQERPADAVALLALLRAARGTLTQAQLDSVPPQASGTALGVGAEEPTTVLSDAGRAALTAPGAPTAAQHQPPDRTARYQVPPDLIEDEEPLAAHRRRGSSRRGPILIAAVLAVLFSIGAVVWYVGAGQFTNVPAVLAMSTVQAEQQLHAAGLGASLAQSYSDTVAVDHVISTDPAPGARIRGNGMVHVVISRGPKKIGVPDLSGKPLTQAQQQLADDGLAVGAVTKAFSDTVPAGSVISTNPSPGTLRQSGAAIALTVSRGKAVAIPDVTGSTVSDAQQTLEAAGFTVQISGTPVYSDTVPKDSVAQESPVGGRQAAAGDTITLSVSKGQQLFEVPDVTGQDVGAASKELQAAGFKVSVIQLFLTGKVFHQTPGANSMQPRNTTITLWAR
jgi:serine/threonine-protein kinase